MGEWLGPGRGWSRLFPGEQGWYEVTTERAIERKEPAVRVWHDGSGTLFASVGDPVNPGKFRWSRVDGSFKGSWFKALGPRLHPSVPASPVPDVLRPYQRPENFLTPGQRLEAEAIERARRKA